jgi:pyruvate formate lyase activating enzyme
MPPPTLLEDRDRPDAAVTARFWHRFDDGRLQCDLCPHRCRLRDGQLGRCFVRAREGDRLVLTTYGRASGFCVDPIEKKPLNHVLPGSAVLSFGTAGCNLSCRFCQNWEISTSREIDTLADAATPTDIAEAAEALGCASVAFTYNDPVIFHEYAVDVAAACRDRSIRTVAVTAGFVEPEPRREFYAAIDAANIDLKAFTPDFYRRLCGARLEPVLDTLRYVAHETDVWLEITTLLIPGHNDSDVEVAGLARWVATELGPDVPLHLTAFSPAHRLTHVPPTPPETLRRARRIALRSGLRFVYTGNIHDLAGGTTTCPGCAQAVIVRDGYTLARYHLDDRGHCRTCGTRLPGVFDGPPGAWGERRRPVRIGTRT